LRDIKGILKNLSNYMCASARSRAGEEKLRDMEGIFRKDRYIYIYIYIPRFVVPF